MRRARGRVPSLEFALEPAEAEVQPGAARARYARREAALTELAGTTPKRLPGPISDEAGPLKTGASLGPAGPRWRARLQLWPRNPAGSQTPPPWPWKTPRDLPYHFSSFLASSMSRASRSISSEERLEAETSSRAATVFSTEPS